MFLLPQRPRGVRSVALSLHRTSGEEAVWFPTSVATVLAAVSELSWQPRAGSVGPLVARGPRLAEQ